MKSKIRLIALVLTFILSSSAIGYWVRAQTELSFTTIIENGAMVQSYSYIIFQDGSNIFAKNGITGAVDYSSTNASYVFNTVIQSLEDNGGSILLKSGKYYLPKSIYLLARDSPTPKLACSGITISGESNGETSYVDATTLIADTGLTGSVIQINPTILGGQYGITICNLIIDGNNKGVNGISSNYVAELDIHNVRIKNCVNGLNLLGVQKSHIYDVRLEANSIDCYLGNDASSNNPNIILFERCDFINSVNYGIYAVQPTPLAVQYTFLRCTIETNNKTGALFTNTEFISFYSSHFEENNKDNAATTDDLSITTSSFIVIDNTMFYGSPNVQYNLHAISTDNMEIRGSRFAQAVNLNTVLFGSITSNLFSGAVSLNIADANIEGNYFSSTLDTTTSSHATFRNNKFSSNPSWVLGSTVIFENNEGFVTENGGALTLTASTSITFNHGLASTPTEVYVGWKTQGYGDWKWAASATQITITVNNTGTYEFSWRAIYKNNYYYP
jgi:hypothetical protein